MINRRRFLQYSAVGLGSLFIPSKIWEDVAQSFPEGQKLGRNCVGGKVDLRAKPDAESKSLAAIYEDTVIVWLRDVVGTAPSGRISHTITVSS
jgi:hypothetical protein